MHRKYGVRNQLAGNISVDSLEKKSEISNIAIINQVLKLAPHFNAITTHKYGCGNVRFSLVKMF